MRCSRCARSRSGPHETSLRPVFQKRPEAGEEDESRTPLSHAFVPTAAPHRIFSALHTCMYLGGHLVLPAGSSRLSTSLRARLRSCSNRRSTNWAALDSRKCSRLCTCEWKETERYKKPKQSEARRVSRMYVLYRAARSWGCAIDLLRSRPVLTLRCPERNLCDCRRAPSFLLPGLYHNNYRGRRRDGKHSFAGATKQVDFERKPPHEYVGVRACIERISCARF